MALDIQATAIAVQKAAHTALTNGSDIVRAAPEGNLRFYTRAQTLDYVAQLLNCIAADAALPDASGVGFTILPGTERVPLDAQARKNLPALVADLIAAGKYTDDEIAEAAARLEANLKVGVSLDPATAENA
jgi:hypothetical protein